MSKPDSTLNSFRTRLLGACALIAGLWWIPAHAQSVNGSCGTVAQTCATGTVTGASDNGFNTQWTCSGTNYGTSSWCTVADQLPTPVNGTCGTTASSCATGTVTRVNDNGFNTQWTCAGTNYGRSSWCSVPDTVVAATAPTVASPVTTPVTTPVISPVRSPVAPVAPVAPPVATPPVAASPVLAGSKLGINLSWVLDWSDREMMFVDVMKDARGFATPSNYWDPVNSPVPVDANGWPTADFGVVFITNPSDPLNRPVSATFPSMFGTYSLSFTGQATIAGAGCCTIQNVNYDPSTNTTTASVVVGPNDTQLGLTFTGTNGGVQNLKLLRPGYALGTTQVFTNQFLKAIAPFSTLRFMDTLQTNNSTVTSWSQRTLPTTPQQSALSGLAWEYVIALANTTGKDIWVNIPVGVNLADTSANNYATQLATLMKATLNPGIHVYLEYSNELWNYAFMQAGTNLAAAVSDSNSGADPTLNYDGVNNEYYWASRRTMHQVQRLSQLFQNVYGAAAINTTIRPLYLSQYVQPYLAEDALSYLKANFGAPSQFIYGVGGAPYFGASDNTSFPDASSAMAGLSSSLPGIESGFATQPYNGGVAYTNISFKGLADFYGLKSLAYEGGTGLTSATASAINEQVESNFALKPLIQTYLADWFGCGNDLFMYFDLAEPEGNIWGAYEDLSLATPKSKALSAVAATPLANYTTCNAQ